MNYHECATCAYREDCATACMGYVPDEDTQAGRDAWDELCADADRDDEVGYEREV